MQWQQVREIDSGTATAAGAFSAAAVQLHSLCCSLSLCVGIHMCTQLLGACFKLAVAVFTHQHQHACRGDVQPYVLLGLEIHSRGHEVAIATESRMQALVQDLGRGLLTYKHISGDPTGMLFEKKYQVCLCVSWWSCCCASSNRRFTQSLHTV